jgi:hypothetical protein
MTDVPLSHGATVTFDRLVPLDVVETAIRALD